MVQLSLATSWVVGVPKPGETHTQSASMLATGGRHQVSLHFLNVDAKNDARSMLIYDTPFLQEVVGSRPFSRLVASSSSRKLQRGDASVKHIM